jgi:hypothetical protein
VRGVRGSNRVKQGQTGSNRVKQGQSVGLGGLTEEGEGKERQGDQEEIERPLRCVETTGVFQGCCRSVTGVLRYRSGILGA